jgi:hypothetical protein
MSEKEFYVPGNINIGRKEKDRRYKNGWIWLMVTVLLFLVLVYLNVPRVFRLVLYIPATMSALGFLQAAYSFCVYYGLKKEYRMNEENNSVHDDENILADRKTSINIIIVALSIGFVVTILAYLLL